MVKTHVSFTPQILADDLMICTIKSLSISIPPETAGKLYMILQIVSNIFV